jgi:hypothetical protein
MVTAGSAAAGWAATGAARVNATAAAISESTRMVFPSFD